MRDLRGKMLAFKKKIAITSRDLEGFPRGQGLRSGPLHSKKCGVLRFRCEAHKGDKREIRSKEFWGGGCVAA